MNDLKQNSQTVSIWIDGVKTEATAGETVLAVARRIGVRIPALCTHDALPSAGACRVCLVEIMRTEADAAGEIVTSCEYPAKEGLRVETRTDRVRRQRRMVLSLIAARCPDSKVVQALADREGGVIDIAESNQRDNCLLCTLCTRACAALGVEAIVTTGRGPDKKISPPFGGAAELCVGCGTCARICPTGCIEMKDTPESREIWGKAHPFIRCEVCGAPTVTADYAAHAVARFGLDESYYNVCATCRKNRAAAQFSALSFPQDTGA